LKNVDSRVVLYQIYDSFVFNVNCLCVAVARKELLFGPVDLDASWIRLVNLPRTPSSANNPDSSAAA